MRTERGRGGGKRETWATCVGRCAGAVSKFETGNENGARKPGRREHQGPSCQVRPLRTPARGPEDRGAVTSLRTSPSQQHAAAGKAAAHALTFFPRRASRKWGLLIACLAFLVIPLKGPLSEIKKGPLSCGPVRYIGWRE
jgi:hypothetical protein